MKYKFYHSLRFILIVLILTFNFSCEKLIKKETENALENRLDTILSKMSMQEKIEQLYYLTEGNGLIYTSFDYKNLKLNKNKISLKKGETKIVSFEITNEKIIIL